MQGYFTSTGIRNDSKKSKRFLPINIVVDFVLIQVK